MKKLFLSYSKILLSFFLLYFNSGVAFTANSAQKTFSDSWITTKVKTQLAANNITKATSITVETNNGIVTLTGNVSSDTEANTAVEISESVNGVKDVDASNLTVSGSNQPMQDSYITSKIKGLFLREKLLHNTKMPVTDIKVETQNGVVYLSGEIARKSYGDRAIALAKSVNGVTQVTANFKLKANK